MVTVVHQDQHPGDNADATVASGVNATVNHASGTVTVTGLTTAASAVYSQTILNSFVTADSVVVASAYNGTNTSTGLTINEITPSAGQVIIAVKNTNAGALNGSINIAFAVLT